MYENNLCFIFSLEPTTCEAGWIPWRSSCYGVIKGLAKKWSDAQADCKRRFGDLLIINDQEEQDFITNEISSLDVVCLSFKGCVHYIFANLFCKHKGMHL